MLIKIRTGHEMIALDDKTTIIGSPTPGLAQSFPDPEQKILRYLSPLLSHAISYDTAVSDFSSASSIPISFARKIIDSFIENGHIELVSPSQTLSLEDQERYSRSVAYLDWINRGPISTRWESIETLQEKNVAILGMGGIGGGIAYNLISSGIKNLTIVDFDTVELSNLNRQILFDLESVGKPKTDQAAKRLKEYNPNINIVTIEQKIDSEDCLEKVLTSEFDFLLCCADTPNEIYDWINSYCVKNEIAWMLASYNGPIIQCGIFVPKKTGCYTCFMESAIKNLHDHNRSTSYLNDPRHEITPAFGPVVQIASGLASYEAIRYLLNLNPQTVGNVMHQNLYQYDASYSIPVPNECPHFLNGEKK
ncbi:ThiF family adenylyltransferase [Alloscardovia venturai]|uniref:ThiF family adenylyltransferase n=1 Tax=Alloscardovia venturai TaxID=1769421 RepID=A0ABW2YAD2_9BIFI